MKKFIVFLFLSLLVGSTSNKQINNSVYVYNNNKSFAQNFMLTASNTPWKLKDVKIPSSDQINKDSNFNFELSYTALGATKDLSSIGNVFSGAGAFGLAALAMPESLSTSEKESLMILITKEELIANEGEDPEEKAFNAISKRLFDLIRNNHKNVEFDLYGTRNVVAEIKPIRKSSIFGKSTTLEFDNLPPESKKSRNCPHACSIYISKSGISISDSVSSDLARRFNPKATNTEHFI